MSKPGKDETLGYNSLNLVGWAKFFFLCTSVKLRDKLSGLTLSIHDDETSIVNSYRYSRSKWGKTGERDYWFLEVL